MTATGITATVLAAVVQYGLPALFGLVLVSAIGVPLPVTFVLIAAGSLVAQGDFNYWTVVAIGVLAAVIGDNIGYVVGRWGGRPLLDRVSKLIGGAKRMDAAEHATRRWGGPGVFLSRWLFTALGPPVNLTSGIIGYAWLAFLIYDLAGETIWLAGYVGLGRIFSDQVEAMTALLGDISTIALVLIVVLILGYFAIRALRRPRNVPESVIAATPDDRA